MNVVGRDSAAYDNDIIFSADHSDQLPDAKSDFAFQNGIAIFREPDDMILQFISSV